VALIRWSEQAVTDAEQIASFIAFDSKYYSKLFLKSLRTRILNLVEFPEMGRVVPEIANATI